MKNKTNQQFTATTWLALFLAVTFLTGCSPDETPPTAAPTLTGLAATPTTLAEATTVTFSPLASPSPTPTPGQTATPASTQPTASPTSPASPTPDSFTREGDTLSSSTPGTPSAVFVVPCVVGPNALQLRSGPGPGFDSFKTLPGGTALSALKYYNANGLWLLVETKQVRGTFA